MGLPLASARWSQVEGRRTSSKLVAHPRTFPGGLCFVKLFNSQKKDYVTQQTPDTQLHPSSVVARVENLDGKLGELLGDEFELTN